VTDFFRLILLSLEGAVLGPNGELEDNIPFPPYGDKAEEELFIIIGIGGDGEVGGKLVSIEYKIINSPPLPLLTHAHVKFVSRLLSVLPVLYFVNYFYFAENGFLN